MTATSTDVAREAGVSRATVSQVLNGHAHRFAAETAAKVFDAAKSLGYEPSAAGRTLRKGSSDFVVALLPNVTFGTNLQQLFEEMSSDLSAHGYSLVLRMSSESTDALDRVIASLRPAAVFSLARFTDAERAVFEARGTLAIDPPSASVIDSHRAIGEMQARALVAAGHSRLGFVHLSDVRQDPFGAGREEGVRAVAEQLGLPEPRVAFSDIDLDQAIAALQSLEPPGIAIACYNDDVAMTMMAAARVLELDVPGDVAIIGMDHTALSRVTVPRLTTIEYDLARAASEGTAQLLDSLGAGRPVTRNVGTALRLVPGETV